MPERGWKEWDCHRHCFPVGNPKMMVSMKDSPVPSGPIVRLIDLNLPSEKLDE